MSFSQDNHHRHYQIAGITIRVESELPITDSTFHPKFEHFRVDGSGEVTLFVRHHFSIPAFTRQFLGPLVYRKPPWAIYRARDGWVYAEISNDPDDLCVPKVVVFNKDHTRAEIYNRESEKEVYFSGNLPSLTLFPTDQILLARVLADRRGCYLHAAGVILDGKGLLFVGHSEAGKSTMVKMLKGRAEILCDDRMIVREWHEGFRIHGTWSHGEIPDVSPNAAPLRALLLLEQSSENRLVRVTKKSVILHKLLACLIRPFLTEDWWDKMLPLIDQIASRVPCYDLQFDKSGNVVDVLEEFIESGVSPNDP